MKKRLCCYFIIPAVFLVFQLSGCTRQPEEFRPDLLWLRNELITINTPDPLLDEPALDTILEKIGNARIVGLGEGTHGTREFWQLRQKITRYLVEKKGFNAVLMEAGFPSSFLLHEYITTGSGTYSEAHQKLGSWKFLEMQEFISWMRQYNISHPGSNGDPSLHFYGYDTAFRNWTEAIRLIAAYIQKVDAGNVDEITVRLEKQTKEEAVYVSELFEAGRSSYISASSETEYNVIFRIVKNLISSKEILDRLSSDKPTLEYRDSVNIQNITCILDNLLPGCKVVIWAHNGHIRDGFMNDYNGRARMLGSFLRRKYGDQYYNIATEFWGGSFLAWDECFGHDFLFVENQAAVPPADSYTSRFNEVLVPQFFLDLSGVDYSDPRAAWLAGPARIRMIGATYCTYADFQYYDTLSLPEYYNGIVFLKFSTPTTAITF